MNPEDVIPKSNAWCCEFEFIKNEEKDKYTSKPTKICPYHEMDYSKPKGERSYCNYLDQYLALEFEKECDIE